MPDAGEKEEPQPVILLAAEFLRHLVVVINGVLWRRTRIRPSVPQQKLSAARFELREVRIVGFDDAACVLERERKILVDIERHDVPLRILMAEVTRRVGVQRIHRSSWRRYTELGFEPR